MPAETAPRAAPAPSDRRRRRVGEEHHEADDRLQDGAREPETRQGHGAEVTDHGRIGEQERGFGDERAEGGHRETHDVAVDGAPIW